MQCLPFHHRDAERDRQKRIRECTALCSERPTPHRSSAGGGTEKRNKVKVKAKEEE